jgi:hypothetical protein
MYAIQVCNSALLIARTVVSCKILDNDILYCLLMIKKFPFLISFHVLGFYGRRFPSSSHKVRIMVCLAFI